MTEIAFFDSYPTNNQAGFNGAWNVYPYFESGNIIISDRSEGMLLVRPLSTLGVDEQKQLVFEIFPNPTHGNITIKSSSGTIDSVTITEVSGKQVYAETAVLDGISKEIDISALSNGLYIVTVNNTESHKVIKQ